MNKKEPALELKDCPVCQGKEIQVFIEINKVPVFCNVLWNSKAEAVSAPTGNIKLGFCKKCGHIFNLDYDPDLVKYTKDYENSLYFSPYFKDYTKSIINYLIEQYHLYEKLIVEIGCGQGDFLKLICEQGNNYGIGFDPSYNLEKKQKVSLENKITFIKDNYSEKYSFYKPDFICGRHVLEHVPFPRNFISAVRRSLGNKLDTAVFFEVPNARYILKNLGIWDLIYEHYSYFNIHSLGYLFKECGFRVCNLRETYNDQYLTIEAVPDKRSRKKAPKLSGDFLNISAKIAIFAKEYKKKTKLWQERIDYFKKSGKKVVVWGGGSKGITFLNILKSKDIINSIVDVNPRKHGRFIPITGQQIISPENVINYKPDIIIIMNRIYKAEIEKICKGLSLNVEFICV